MNNIVKGIFILLIFFLLGDLLSALMGGFVPGNVLGMLLLFLALCLRLVDADAVRPVANGLIKNMMLFFVPAAVGLMEQIDLISQFWLAFTVICVVTTLAVVAFVGVFQQWLQSHKEKRKLRHAPVTYNELEKDEWDND